MSRIVALLTVIVFANGCSSASNLRSDYDPDADIYGVAEQQARMQALREDIAEKRAAALERKREAAARTPPPAQPEPPAWPAYRWPVFWPLPPRPQPPVAPPQRPPSVIVPPLAEQPQ